MPSKKLNRGGISMIEAMWFAMLLGFAASFAAVLTMVVFTPTIQRFTLSRNDLQAVQASHVGHPLRFGGLAVFFGICLGTYALKAPSDGTFTRAVLVSCLPVLVAGGLEDAGVAVSARIRLFAAFFASGIAIYLLGFWVARADLLVIDLVLALVPLAIVVNITVAAGFCHALNLVDGMNGLAAVNIIIIGTAIASIASDSGLDQIMMLAMLASVSTLAFLLFNWPFGKVFLGDAGSYALGHLLVWLSISLVALDTDIAVAALLLVLFWPIMDMLHAIARRLARRVPLFKPDRLHFHQIIRRGLEVVWLGRDQRIVSNPLATLLMVPVMLVPVLLGVILKNEPVLSWVVFFFCAVAYSLLHYAVVALCRLRRKRHAFGKGFDRIVDAQ